MAALAAVVVLTSCSGGNPTEGVTSSKAPEPPSPAAVYAREGADRIQAEMSSAVQGAQSFRIAGAFRQKVALFRFDFRVSSSFECEGRYTSGLAPDFDMRVVDEGPRLGVYLRGDGEALRAYGLSAGTVARYQGRWTTMKDQGPHGGYCPRQAMLGPVLETFGFSAQEVDRKVIGPGRAWGRPAVRLAMTNPLTHERLTLWVAATAPHYLLKLRGDRGSSLRLSGYDRPLDVVAPANVAD